MRLEISKNYINLLKTYPSIAQKYMMDQYLITKDIYTSINKNIFDNKTIWILKPIKGFLN